MSHRVGSIVSRGLRTVSWIAFSGDSGALVIQSLRSQRARPLGPSALARSPTSLSSQRRSISTSSLLLQQLAISETEKVQLRPYQEECIQACLAKLGLGKTRIGVSLPTGSGKVSCKGFAPSSLNFSLSLIQTVIFAQLFPRISARVNQDGSVGDCVLIIVSSVNLAEQTSHAIGFMHPTLSVEIEQGAQTASGTANVTVATRQTLDRSPARLEKFDPARLKCVIVDEAHHAASKSNRRILSHFDPSISLLPDTDKAGAPVAEKLQPASTDQHNASSSIPSVPIFGFTATFSRNDRLVLGDVFQCVAYHKDLGDMVQEGYLSRIEGGTMLVDIKENVIKTSKDHDFQAKSLDKAINTPEINQIVVQTWAEKAVGRKSTLTFCINIKHVEALTLEFQAAGVDARRIHNLIPAAEVKQTLEDFKACKFPVLVNCGEISACSRVLRKPH